MAYSRCFFCCFMACHMKKAGCLVRSSERWTDAKNSLHRKKQQRRWIRTDKERKEETNGKERAGSESKVNGAAFRKGISECFFCAIAYGTEPVAGIRSYADHQEENI